MSKQLQSQTGLDLVEPTQMVVTSQPLAVQAGLKIMQQGGNAVDAALAAAITLTVVEPTGNGLGSDAFALVWDGHELHGLNGSGRSPATWEPERFAGREEMPNHGWDSVTVPGAVSAWVTLHAKFGTMEFAELFKPAIGHAHDGFRVTEHIRQRWQSAAEPLAGYQEFSRLYLPEGKPVSHGELFRNPDLGRSLDLIAKTRGEDFYRGALAQMMVDCAANAGGALSRADLATHGSEWVRPLTIPYQGYDVYEVGPNSQGVAALIALGILDLLNVGQYECDSVESVHLQVEAMKLAFGDVMRHVSDPETMRIDANQFLEPHYLAKRAKQISLDKAQFPHSGIPESPGTVYLSTADQHGMMVSFIQSNYLGFGSGIVVPGTGIALNNRASGFTLEQDHPNQVAGGKRPFHTIIPGFIMQQGVPFMSFGVMGAHMQAQGHVQMAVRTINYHQDPQSASDAPRWQLLPDSSLALEQGFDESLIKQLESRGHQIVRDAETHTFGGAQLIRKTDRGYCGGSDHRKDGYVGGNE
ncbi:MAG: gamma-glutamyltransferase family protein [Desulfobulbaceae bacterium]|nr:MAG: gamma-glutamyltransferase family protein [Desulfobulbaceae bacterium]